MVWSVLNGNDLFEVDTYSLKEYTSVMTSDQLDEFFTYHKPTATQPARYEALRDKAKELAYLIDAMCPDSADKSAAIRKLRECVMTANASIALEAAS